jgi:hypothetical protein
MSHPPGMIGRMRENKRTGANGALLEQPPLLGLPDPECYGPLAPAKPAKRVRSAGALSESDRLVGLAGVAEAREALLSAGLRAGAARTPGKAA